MNIRLGVKARDKISGLEGIVTARVEYLYGYVQWGLAPPAKDGEIKNTQYIDEGRVEFIGEGVAPSEVRVDVGGAGDSPGSARMHP
jgi:hypothetical protein